MIPILQVYNTYNDATPLRGPFNGEGGCIETVKQTRKKSHPYTSVTGLPAAADRPPRSERLELPTPTTYLGSCGCILCRRRNESYESLFSSIDLGRIPS